MYPETVARCQHLKVNGTQCGSPALRNERFCFFHQEQKQNHPAIDPNSKSKVDRKSNRRAVQMILPVLEDANSIQVALMQVMRLLISAQIDHRTAGLLLYALQTASVNLARTTFEPELPTRVVIDRAAVSRRPIGATAWSSEKDREYDDQDAKKEDNQAESLAKILLQRMGLANVKPVLCGEQEEGDTEEFNDSEMESAP
jgi:hypothetical protein